MYGNIAIITSAALFVLTQFSITLVVFLGVIQLLLIGEMNSAAIFGYTVLYVAKDVASFAVATASILCFAYLGYEKK